MKRVLSIFLMLVLTISTATTFAYADSWKFESGNKIPPGLAKKGGFPPGIAKKFIDIDHYKWAEGAIEKMVEKGVIKGIGNGRFAPKRSVTKLEAIVMALRVMGEENEANAYLQDILEGEKKFKLKDHLQEWAYGYVALAEEKEILDEADILYFQLKDSATRHEVAKYLVRAMGYEDEAQDHMDEDLDYKDASFIPSGSIGYVYVADLKGIITGYEDDTFRPFNHVTRAEMAVMVARISGEDINEDEDYDIYRGEVTDIDSNYDWIEIDDDDRFEVVRSTDVVFDDEEGDIKDIEEGDEVKIKVNEDDEAIKIYVDRNLYDIYEGEVTDIDSDYDWIEIDDDDRFEVVRSTDVVFDDEEGDIEDIEEGDEVKVKVNEDDEAIKIEVERDLYEMYEGEVEDIDNDNEWIEIEVGSRDKTFDVSDDVEVYFEDNDEGDFDDIEIGDDVTFKVNEDDEVINIDVDRELETKDYRGSISYIREDDDEYVFSVYTSRKTIDFLVEDDFDVQFDDDEGTIEDVRIGDEVEINIEDGDIEEITVDRDIDINLINGEIFDIYSAENKIAVAEDSEIEIYTLTDDAKVYLNDEAVRLSTLEKSDDVGLEIEDDEVIVVRAYRK